MISNGLFLLASAIFLVAFWLYNRDFLRGGFVPAFAAWGVFTVITCVNSVTYLKVTASWMTIALFATDFFVCAGTSAIILYRTKFRVTVSVRDWLIALGSLLSIIPWIVFRKAAGGNLLNLIPYSIAWIPIHLNWREEPTLPWLLDSIAFALNIAALAIQHDRHWVDYISPVVCLFHHSLITILSMRSSKPAPAMVPEAPQS